MTWALLLDLFGVFFFAISGSLLAAGRGFDIVGSLMLGALTGLGGGLIRDLILGVPPAAFTEPVHLVPPLLSAGLVFFFARRLQTLTSTLLVFDAAGLALFCTTGTVTALRAGMNPAGAVVLGVTTGVGGGLLRDVVANRDPQLFNPDDLYAVPAVLGAAFTAALWSAGLLTTLSGFAAAAAVFVFRVLSLHFHWHIPHAQRRGQADDGHREDGGRG